MLAWITVVALGLIEGLTEFLPVSSTGHLLLAQRWLTRQSDLFNTVIQCGAVLAVLVIFKDRLIHLVRHWRLRAAQDYLAKLGVAFGITGAGGLVLKKLDFKLPETTQPVAVATLIGGILFVVIERWIRHRPQRDRIGWDVAMAMGVAQLLAAIFPGTSRSGATMLVALVLGTRRPAAAEFSFLLGIPTLLAAGALQTVTALKTSGESIAWGELALGSGVAALTAFGVVKWLLHFIQTHTFTLFGWYRMALGLIILIGMN